MTRTTKFLLLVMGIFLLILSGCEGNDAVPQPVDQMPAGLDNGPFNLLPDEWTEIIPEEFFRDFTYKGLAPGCVGAPKPDGTFTDDEFSFFVKGGEVNNLVVYFEGGGACWNKTTCITAAENICKQEVDLTVQDFEDWAIGIQYVSEGNPDNIEKGIFLDSEDNPFQDWSFIYIPYCTGDIHLGAQDTDYAGPLDQEPQVIQHRGAVNFQLVLKYMRERVTTAPEQIFVTGSSAGSYGAMMHFPHIKELFPDSDLAVIGDAGCGVSAKGFQDTIHAAWNIQLPEQYIPEFEKNKFFEMTVADMIVYNASQYPNDRFGEYTTEADTVQVFFYGLFAEDILPLLPDWPIFDALELLVFAQKFYDESDTALLDKYTGFWSSIMMTDRKTIESKLTLAGMSNYKYYIGDGNEHTIMMRPEFYTETSADALEGPVTGKSFLEWVNEMIDPDFDWAASSSYIVP